jgi:hypothetical protein
LVAAFCIFSLGNLVRSFRFVQLDHTDKKLTHWWNTNALYNLMTATLPGGAGEAATAYVLKRFSLFNMLGAFRILLVSRIMDVCSLSLLFFLAAVQMGSSTPYREAAICLTGILFLISFIALIPASELFFIKLLQRLPGERAFIEKVSNKLNELRKLVKERQSVGFYSLTMTQSTIAIIGGVVTLNLLLRSFGIDFTPVQSIYCYGVYAVFQIVPFQGIAGIGTQAAWWALALNAVDYNAPDAIAMGFMLYGSFYVFIAILGLLTILVWLINRKSN